ncbi:hypothetical protein Bca52824_032787 [Brassica carinata]|uniref:Reverse transcriptase zinc-binding domain-containing protein n=1 Tax=Brassica carinata TaxID=52824 RepID=A0A8X7SD22_BRACI|nr:hypothetical protein Bca52824_032787 [Brassica carinata]
MTSPGREWNRELIENIFPPDIQEVILVTNLQGLFGEDSYSWDYTSTGHYSVKSSYWVQRNIINADLRPKEVNQPSLDGLYQQIWKLKASPKVDHFLWKCVSGSLPAAANMRKRHIAKDGCCARCGMDSESVNHILFTCPYARLVWAVSPIRAPPNAKEAFSLQNHVPKLCCIVPNWLKHVYETDLSDVCLNFVGE